MGKYADAIAAAHEGHVAARDIGHQREDLRLDPRLGRVAGFRVIADAARPAADDDTRIGVKRERFGQRLLIQPDATDTAFIQTALFEDRAVFAIGPVVFGAQLQDQEGFCHSCPG